VTHSVFLPDSQRTHHRDSDGKDPSRRLAVLDRRQTLQCERDMSPFRVSPTCSYQWKNTAQRYGLGGADTQVPAQHAAAQHYAHSVVEQLFSSTLL
jgi:hypothetical protein